MLETIGIILLVLVGIVILCWVAAAVVTLVIGNKLRKRVQAEIDKEPFFRDTNPVRRANNWRNHNGF